MWKWFKWVLLTVGILIFLFLVMMAQPWVFLPHKHIEISLPFAPEDDAYTSLIPLGEKIEHNASNGTPDGHPGIDFGWNKETRILAVADGRIMGITKDKNNKYRIEINMGLYRTTYQEMNSVEPNLHFLSKVKKGQLLGYSGHYRKEENKIKSESDPSGQIHWDFASSSMIIDRLCPVNYFDPDSKRRIEVIWARVPANDQFKLQYPQICNGIFQGKED